MKMTRFFRALSLILSFSLPWRFSLGNNLITDWLEEGYGLPQIPRFTVWGFTGTDTYARGEALLPVFGQPESFFYSDIQSKAGRENAWSASASVGFRQNVQTARILGAYLFVDRNIAWNHQVFTDLSPGIESMGTLWDFRANGYFPLGAESHHVGNFYGAELGDYSYVRHTQHLELDRLFSVDESIGKGVDGEVGRVVPGTQHVRFYVGGYYFTPKNAEDITGVSTRLTVPVNHYFALEARDTYDKINGNTALVDLRLTFGGIADDQTSDDVSTRIMDPIERNLMSQNTSTAVPVVEGRTVIANETISKDNIYFFTNASNGTNFSAMAAASECTFEHPCDATAFNQNTLNTINEKTPNANLYFNNTGTSLYEVTQELNIPKGESLWGRSSDYQSPAPDSDRPTFRGSFKLNGNNSLNNLTFDGGNFNEPNSADPIIAIEIDGANNIQINDVNIAHYHGIKGADGVYNNMPTGREGGKGESAVGIDIKNASNVSLKNVVIDDITGGQGGIASDGAAVAGIATGGQGGAGGNAIALNIENSSHIKIENMTAKNIMAGAGGAGGEGLFIDSDEKPGEGIGGHGGAGGIASGITVLRSDQVTLSHASISNIIAGAGATGGMAYSITAKDPTTGKAGQGGAGGQVTAINIEKSSNIKLSDINMTMLMGGKGEEGGSVITAGNQANIAIAGNGGKAGAADGVKINDSNSVAVNNVIATTIMGGNGGDGGSTANVGTNSTAGQGGSGGNAAAVLSMNSSQVDIVNVISNDILQGLDGADGMIF